MQERKGKTFADNVESRAQQGLGPALSQALGLVAAQHVWEQVEGCGSNLRFRLAKHNVIATSPGEVAEWLKATVC